MSSQPVCQQLYARDLFSKLLEGTHQVNALTTYELLVETRYPTLLSLSGFDLCIIQLTKPVSPDILSQISSLRHESAYTQVFMYGVVDFIDNPRDRCSFSRKTLNIGMFMTRICRSHKEVGLMWSPDEVVF